MSGYVPKSEYDADIAERDKRISRQVIEADKSDAYINLPVAVATVYQCCRRQLCSHRRPAHCI